MIQTRWPLVKALKTRIELLNSRLDTRIEEKRHTMSDYPRIKVPVFKMTQLIGFSYI
jgi:hypothetical protein